MPAKAANDLPRFKIRGGRAKLMTGRIIERDVEVRLGGVVGIHAFKNETFHDQRPILSLQPNLLDLNYRGMNAVEFDVCHIGRSPERRDAAREHRTGHAD